MALGQDPAMQQFCTHRIFFTPIRASRNSNRQDAIDSLTTSFKNDALQYTPTSFQSKEDRFVVNTCERR